MKAATTQHARAGASCLRCLIYRTIILVLIAIALNWTVFAWVELLTGLWSVFNWLARVL